jgi:hypothetical protein
VNKLADLQVQKKDGSLQPWEGDKILKSVVAAGVPAKEAESFLDLIQTYAQRVAKNGVVLSFDIKTKLISLIRAIYPEAAIAFKTYKKKTEPVIGKIIH